VWIKRDEWSAQRGNIERLSLWISRAQFLSLQSDRGRALGRKLHTHNHTVMHFSGWTRIINWNELLILSFFSQTSPLFHCKFMAWTMVKLSKTQIIIRSGGCFISICRGISIFMGLLVFLFFLSFTIFFSTKYAYEVGY
jgi:hypothetical protein